MTPAALDTLSPEERHNVYKMLRLSVEVFPDGSLNVTGILRDSFVSENQDERLSSSVQNTMTSKVRFQPCWPKIVPESYTWQGFRFNANGRSADERARSETTC